MNIYALSALINAITSLSLGSFLFLKNKRGRTSNTFILLSLAVFIWSFFYFLWQISKSYDMALLFVRLLSIGSTMVPIFYLHWILSFLEIKDKKSNIVLSFGYIITLIFISFSFSDFFIKGLEKTLMFDFWPKAGWLYSIYLATSYLGLIGYGLNKLIQEYHKTTGIKLYQIKYIIFGTIIGFLGGATNFFLWYDINILPLGNIIVSLYVFILFYAMVRYRLMDIQSIAKKFFKYFIVSSFVYLTFYFLVWLCNNFFGGMFTTTTYFMGILIAPLFIFIFYLLDRNINLIADKYLFTSIHNQQEAIIKLTNELTDYIDINKIISLIENTTKEALRTSEIAIFLLNPEKKYQSFNKENIFKDSFLIEYIKTTQKILVREELTIMSNNSIHEENKQEFLKTYEHMKEANASLCVPLIANKKLIGIMTLSSKISTDPYTEEDLNLLNTLSKQASIAIENARQYKEINDFKRILQEKVKEQTKEIKEKNKHLKELLNIKSEFLKIASHQLNTPLSIMRGYISLLKEKDCDQEKALPIIENALKRIINTVSVFFDAYNLEGEKMKIETSVIDIGKLINKIVKEKRDLISNEKKDLKIVIKKPDFKLPDIRCDEKRIAYVVSSLLDNSIFYSLKGKISICYKKENKYLKIIIQDNGIGIPEEDYERIFHKFSRGINAPNMHPDGSGISLYMSKKIIEGHKGEISFKNRTDTKGTMFTFTLPIS